MASGPRKRKAGASNPASKMQTGAMSCPKTGIIVERKQTEYELRQSQRMLQLVLDTIPVRVFWKDRESRYLGCNRLFAVDAGFSSPEEVVGRTDSEMGWREHAECYRDDDRQVIETGSPKVNYEEPQTTPEGKRIWLRTSKIPLRDDRGVAIGVLGTYEDITEGRKAQETLRYRLDFEKLIAAISTRFINLHPDEIDSGVHAALEEIGRFMKVDRSYVFLFCDDGLYMDNTHEWCVEGVGSHVRRLKKLPIADFPSVAEEIRRGEVVLIRTVSALGPDCAREKAEFEREGIRSLVMVPLSCRGHVQGFLGLDSVREERVFSDDSVNLLRLVGECLAGMLERKRYEQALRNENTFRRAIVERAAEGLCVCHEIPEPPNIHFTVWNRRMIEITGYTVEEINRNGWYQTLYADPEVRARAQARMDRMRVGEDLLAEEWEITRKDGARRTISISTTAIMEAGDQPHVLALLHDLTDRKQAEDALRESSEFSRQVIASAHEGIAVYDRELRYIVWNPYMEKLSGEPAHEVLGRKAIEVHPFLREAGVLENLERALAGETVTTPDIPIPAVGGRDAGWTSASHSPLRDAHGAIIGVIGVIRDITERKRAESERHRLEAQVQHVQKLESLGVLAGGIAHDFNNLLMVILGNADLAMRALSHVSPAQGYLRDIETASRRAADLCRQMLAYSGKGRFVVEALNLNEVVEEMTRMLEVSISKKALLKFNLAAKLPTFDADATQARQVLMNLITNASEAIGEKNGIISITTGAMHCDRSYLCETYLSDNLEEGLYVYVEVADTGCGMTAEVRGRIFDPFFTTKFTGRGLGMAAVLGIVRGHKGAIKVYSEPGKGTTIKVLFPASEKTPVQTRAERGSMQDWKGSGTVLVVDDEETVRVVTQHMLELMGFQVILSNDGRAALSLFAERHADIACVLLDLTMPHMDGEEAYREMRRIDKNVKVVMSSGYNEQEITQRFVGKGLAGFIQKPFQFEALQEKLREVLGGQEERASR